MTQTLIKTDLAAEPLPPAVALPLTGKHLIEASAGTGKTWTLTGVVLRLIVESGQPCERIIATTFTRSAAAEMRQRIRERLQDFYRVVQLVRNHELTLPRPPATPSIQSDHTQPTKNRDDNRELILTADQQVAVDTFFEQLAVIATRYGLDKTLEDPINTHLIRWLASQVVSQPKPDVDFRVAYQRTATALNQLDRLFVGTLDSLCQKWLREFSSDTGFSPDIQIRDNVDDIMLGMIHDQLRAFLAQIYSSNPTLYHLIQKRKILSSPQDYLKVVEQAQAFYSATIDEIHLNFDLNYALNLAREIAQADDSDLLPYLVKEYRKKQGINLSTNLGKKFDGYSELKQKLGLWNLEELMDLETVDKPSNAWLIAIDKLFTQDKGFNKDNDDNREIFKQLPTIQRLHQLYQAIQATEQFLVDIGYYFTQFISRHVREQLPNVLEAQRLTTYSLQLARLNKALAGEQGLQLARYIRHQYPNALIDESQDLNTEQALMIQRIYLDSHDTPANHADQSRQNARQAAGFLLLVGDPKQAIYGFRGGDVYNYNALKRLFHNKPMTLTQNRRSSKPLVDALNVWFGAPTPTSIDETLRTLNAANPSAARDQRFYLGDEIYYQHIQATRELPELTLASDSDGKLDLPAIYHLQILKPKKESDPEQDDAENLSEGQVIAAQIAALLTQGEIFSQAEDKNLLVLGGKPLTPNDICVLARTNPDLTEVERALTKRGIASVRIGSQSVFADRMAKDLLTLMYAMLAPYQFNKIKALLLTNFFQLTLKQAQAVFNEDMLDDAQNPTSSTSIRDAAHIQTILAQSGEVWQRQGFLAAVQWLLNQTVLVSTKPSHNFWQKLASHRDGERLLVDLRQLLDIINEQISQHQTSDYQLVDWLSEMVNEPPKDDWAKQHTLASQQGVQLMTMHGSKGLEFPIVFVTGISGIANKKSKQLTLYRYDAHDIDPSTDRSKIGLQGRRLSASPQLISSQTDLVAIQKRQSYEDALRLLYVAMTRARERLYVVTMGEAAATASQEKKSAATNDYVLNAFAQDMKTLTLHDDLQPYIQLVDINLLATFIDKKYRYYAPQSNAIPRQVVDYHALQKDFTLSFKGWANTSFTALARFLDHNQQDVAVNHSDFEKNADSVMNDNVNTFQTSNHMHSQADTPANMDMRFRFDKGISAGTFLHRVLEDIAQYYHETPTKNQADHPINSEQLTQTLFRSPRWAAMMDRALRNQQMPAKYFSTEAASQQAIKYDQAIDQPQQDYLALSEWLFDIIHTPFGATGRSLVEIDSKHKIAEMSFSLRLKNDLAIEPLNQLLNKHGIALTLQGQGSPQAIWQYLRGEIDLVYQHGNRFYVVDYKSNFLGDAFFNYHEAVMKHEMDKHGYWLQASIYQVALHRFLKLRLPNYRPEQHLGEVEYAFVRGMSQQQGDCGKLLWQPSIELIDELDEFFGSL